MCVCVCVLVNDFKCTSVFCAVRSEEIRRSEEESRHVELIARKNLSVAVCTKQRSVLYMLL